MGLTEVEQVGLTKVYHIASKIAQQKGIQTANCRTRRWGKCGFGGQGELVSGIRIATWHVELGPLYCSITIPKVGKQFRRVHIFSRV